MPAKIIESPTFHVAGQFTVTTPVDALYQQSESRSAEFDVDRIGRGCVNVDIVPRPPVPTVATVADVAPMFDVVRVNVIDIDAYGPARCNASDAVKFVAGVTVV